MGLTFGGDTSGITQKGKGPRPTAKDLHEINPDKSTLRSKDHHEPTSRRRQWQYSELSIPLSLAPNPQQKVIPDIPARKS